MFSKIVAFARLSRPHFLIGGVVLYALGAMIARFQGYALDGPLYFVGQLFITSGQLMTHYLNEYWDLEADQLNQSRTLFSGGSGVLPEGSLSRETARVAASVCLAIHIATAVALIAQYGAPPSAWAVMVLVFLGAFFYSTPPVQLSHSGYGEITTSVLVAGFVPAFGHLLQAGQPTLLLLFTTAPLVVLHYVMLLAFEFPDFLADEAAGKKTVLVRIGRRNGAIIHNVLIVLAFGLAVVSVYAHVPSRVALSLVITAPIGVWQIITIRRMQRGEPVAYNRLTLGAVAHFALTAYLMAFSFWVVG